MRKIIIIILSIIAFGLFIQIYFIFKEKNKLKDKFESLSFRAENIKNENEKIKSEIEYFLLPQNLEKEFRARFNYKKLGEKMIIVVPQN
ncbi:hypothetical protein HZC33_02910 [Candidatus Wolfebacteria bacterium]|nr:hypothetical protein [Candidatus Wolfebacteria bacterium]